MKFNNKIKRYTYYLNKKLSTTIHGLTVNKIKGRFSGPKAILNSLPKSGTHLIESLFFELPFIRHFSGRTILINTHDGSFAKGMRRIKSLKKGQFAPAHLQYSDKLYNAIVKQDIKFIQIMRDPRDVIISHLLYIRDIDKTHKSSKYINSLSTDIEQFNAVIDGEFDVIEPFQDVVNKFLGWIDKPAVLTIKFEDLVGSNGGGSDELQAIATQKIINHVGLQLTETEIKEISNKIFSSKSPTFNTGKINKWKNYFTEKHKQICKEKIQYSLEILGYEKDVSW